MGKIFTFCPKNGTIILKNRKKYRDGIYTVDYNAEIRSNVLLIFFLKILVTFQISKVVAMRDNAVNNQVRLRWIICGGAGINDQHPPLAPGCKLSSLCVKECVQMYFLRQR